MLCSPIVRANSSDNYTGASGHITSDGNYGQAVVELGSEKGIQVVDLTSLTAEVYTKLGYSEAVYFHGVAQAKSSDGGVTLEPNFNSVDNTHLNYYGAKYVAYLFAKTIKASDCSLAAYVTDTTEPTKEKDILVNPDYVWADYTAPALSTYSPVAQFTTISDGWYGTAFGDVAGTPDAVSADGSSTNGYYAAETTAGTFKVGQYLLKDGALSNKGKFAGTSDGFAFAFRQIDLTRNFTLTAEAKVLTSSGVNQAAFGLMLRDDCYLPVKDSSILSNYVTASLYEASTSTTNFNFYRQSAALTKTSDTISSLYAADDTASFKIEKVGQVVTLTATYNGNTYTNKLTDFDFAAKDTTYMYAGMFATRGTTVEFTDVVYTDTGASQGA